MDWVQWVIPLIVIAGFILKQLSNKQADGQRRQDRAPAPRPPDADQAKEQPMAGTNRPPEEIRKFLEELRRKRPAAEARPAVREEDLTAQVVRPKRPPKPPPAPPPVPQTRRPVVRSVRPAIAEAIPVRVVPQTPGSPKPPAQPAAFSPTTIVKPTTPAIRQLLELVRNRQNLATAFLLNEVFDGPRSQKPRRRPPFAG
ncbi:MAG: hypothetical protein HY040_24930 [Planctomycetes bacterium]|nr:hypothetical protein [Planctomycetota bacterium]